MRRLASSDEILCAREGHRSPTSKATTKEDIPFLTLIALITSGKEAIKHDFNVARTPVTLCCIFAHTGGDVIAPGGSCRCSTQMEGILVSSRVLIQSEINPRGRTPRREKGKQRRATNCLLHTIKNPRGDETEEEVNDDLAKPRKVHHESKGRFSQDAL